MTTTISLKFSVIASFVLLIPDVNLALAVTPSFVLSAVRFEGNGVGSLDQFDSAGNLLREIPIDGFPSSVAMDRVGNAYVILNQLHIGGGWRVDKYGPAGQSLGTIVPSAGDNLLGLGIDTADRLYVGHNSITDTVRRFELDGAPLGIFATVSTPGPGAPFALEFDSAGRLYVPDSYAVERFDANGASLGVFATVPDFGNTFVTDLAFDSLGTLYVHTLDDKIFKFDTAGAQLDSLNLPGDGGNRFDIDRNDTLYLAGSSITKYSTTGASIGVFAAGRGGEYYDIAIFDPIPEPGTGVLFAIGIVATPRLRRAFCMTAVHHH